MTKTKILVIGFAVWIAILTLWVFILNKRPQSFGSASFPASSEYATTTGWADDGSIVRLDSASDSVGVGTTSPALKFGVAGSIIAEQSSATTTLNLSTNSATVGSCIQLRASNDVLWRVYAGATTTNTGRLIVERGSCQAP